MSHRVSINRNSRYAPIRYEATRPYAERLGKLFMVESRKGADRRIAFIREILLPLVNGEINRMGTPVSPGPGQGEIGNVQIYAGYQDSGRIIFDVHRELAKSLLVTDCREVPCEAISFPSKSFYLHFGVDTGLIENGMVVEGVFVTYLENEKVILIDIVPTGTFSNKAFWNLPMGEQLTGVRVDLKQPSESITSALDRSLDEIIRNNQAALQQIAELEQQLAIQYGQPVKIPSPVENLSEKRGLLHSVLQLVVNTLFFLKAEPDDVDENWEESVPPELVAQLQSTKLGTRKTAENNLANQGYVKVRFVGRRYANTSEAKAVSEALGTGRTMPTHLRRGHFRNQPYGPERSMRKTVFIAPTVVNPGKNEAAGRIYEA